MTDTIDISGMKFKRPVAPKTRLFRKLRLIYLDWQFIVIMRRIERSIIKLEKLKKLEKQLQDS